MQKTSFFDSNRVYDVVLGSVLLVLALAGGLLLWVAGRHERSRGAVGTRSARGKLTTAAGSENSDLRER